jgi:hypothetical protein
VHVDLLGGRNPSEAPVYYVTAVTRSQRRLNFVETACSKAASVFFRRLQEQGKLVKLASDSTELKLATVIMSPDE